MENEKAVMESLSNPKSFWEILKTTFTGINNEGSAKRLTSFYIVAFLLTAITGAYLYAFLIIVERAKAGSVPSTIDTLVIGMFEYLVLMFLITVWLLLGLATVETITSLIKTIRGGAKIEESK